MINVATLPLKASSKEQRSVNFFWAKDVAQIPFTLRCIQNNGDKCLTDQQYTFGVRSLLVDEKVLLMKKDLADVLFQRLIQRSQQSRLSYLSLIHI